ncbi:kinase-like protein [Nadsonia fulvescens var. elongata DSM 6958]|uniref:Kinase-like protein n=1 Tax=Nadsonia fulvescens var. elongata DSM 6958 TaxID=857566 RepID=A0A1E3PIZ3_9ASCO|nr:kinase-like protein [Nadsonia fulvescens var. elongata DSM 6958]
MLKSKPTILKTSSLSNQNPVRLIFNSSRNLVSPDGQVSPSPCDYKMGRKIGEGSYSVVREATHIPSGKKCAVKIISKRLVAGRESMVKNEVNILEKVSQGHKNILTLIDYFETKSNLCLVTDLCLGGELFDRIISRGSFFEDDARKIVSSLLSGIAYLHSREIVHRDLKAENLLFSSPDDDSGLLIADFGFSKIVDKDNLQMLNTYCGTPAYMAPEMFKKCGYGKPVDMWALGILTYFLLCGYAPFGGETPAEEIKAIMEANYDFDQDYGWKDVSEEAQDFIRQCLTLDPERRMIAGDALLHPFLNQQIKRHDLLPMLKSNFPLSRSGSYCSTLQGEGSWVIPQSKDTRMNGVYSCSPENIYQ